MRFIRQKSQRGDTIVEVLICILVISTILAGGFVVTSQSLQTVRDSQERAQAVKVAESQIERMRTITVDGSLSNFCINNSSVAISSSDSASCYFDRDGNFVGTVSSPTYTKANSGPINELYSGTEGVAYKVSVSHDSLEKTKYKVSVKWISAKSHLGKLAMYYKVVDE